MSLNYYIRRYAEDRNGRIDWMNLSLFVSKAGKRKRLCNWKGEPWTDRTSTTNTEPFSLFKGRAAKCHNITIWNGAFPIFNFEEGRIPYVTVPAKDCKACEFHEPAKHYGRKRYASCRWYRENSGMPSMLELWSKAVKDAKEILGS